MKQKVNIVTLGCSKNLVDSEVLMGQLKDNYSIKHDSDEDADVIAVEFFFAGIKPYFQAIMNM